MFESNHIEITNEQKRQLLADAQALLNDDHDARFGARSLELGEPRDVELHVWEELAAREAEMPVIPPEQFARMNARIMAAVKADEQARAALARKAIAEPEQEPDALIERQPQPVYASWWLSVLLLVAIGVVVLVAALATGAMR